MIARSRPTGRTTAASSCSRTTPRSAAGRSTRRRCSAASGPEPWRTSYVEPSHPAERRPLRREPVPASSTTTSARSCSSRRPTTCSTVYFGSLEAIGIDLATPRRAPRRGRLGGADARRLGPRLGGLVRRHGDHAVHVLPAGRRPRPRPDPGRDHLRPRAAGDVHPGHGLASGRSSGRRASRTPTSTARASGSGRPTTSRTRPSTSSRAASASTRTECAALLDRGLPLPAYDQVLKASHAFNLLDARGALSATERAAYIGRVRNLARKVCQAYLGDGRRR